MLSLDRAPRSEYGGSLPGETLIRETQDIRAVEVTKEVYIGYTLLNRHMIGESPAVVAVGAFMSDLTTPDRAYEGVQLATLGRPVLMLDIPGHGLSTPHSSRQITDLCFRRRADSQAEPLVEAVQKIINSEDELDYFGISHGSLLSLKSAELDPSDRVKTVFGIDLPAVKRRLTLGLQAGYMVTDGVLGRKKYLNALKDSVFGEDFEDFKETFEKTAPPTAKKFYKSNPGLFLLNLVASINARPVALESWQKIMDKKSTEISVVTSENGSISDPVAIEKFINDLPEGHQKRSHQTIIEGEDHNVGIVHLMPRAVSWAKTAYNS